ncbi:MAG: hypothetical protein GY838_10470 [bacterium]|nr:hypothetical protein [bacterium]
MSISYHCPKCDALLNPNVRVVLIAHHANRRCIVLMSSKLGEYQVICDKGFDLEVKKGDAVDFLCPVCAQSLTSEKHETFTELKVVDPQHRDRPAGLVRFSRVCDEHATFLYHNDGVKAFGEEAGLFRDNLAIEGDWGW